MQTKEEISNYNKIYRETHKEEILKTAKLYYENNKEKIKSYYARPEIAERRREQQKKSRKNPERLKKTKERVKKTYREYPEKHLLSNSKYRAKQKGLEHNITSEDIIIPEFCPVLGIPIFIGNGRNTLNSPTLDRIDNNKGYIKGNVIVVSYRTNMIKNNATVEELYKIADFYHNLMKEKL